MKRSPPAMIGCNIVAPALMLVLMASVVWAQTARDVARKAFPSVVVILAPQTKGKAISLGSGFFVRPGVVVTNYHVIKGASSLYVKLVGRAQSYAVGKVLSVDIERDLALLRVDEPDAPPLPLADSSGLEVGDEVYAIGNPEGLEGTLSQGIVSGIRELDGQQYIQITAPISHGSSGGPILNKSGQVVAIAVAALRSGQSLNFATPGAYLTKLLVANPQGGTYTPEQHEREIDARAPGASKARGPVGNPKAKADARKESRPLENIDAGSEEAKELLPLLAAVKRSPKSARAHFDLAEGCRKLFWVCDVRRASDEYLAAIGLDDGYRDAYLGLGEIYRDYGLANYSVDYLTEAVNSFVKAIALEPRKPVSPMLI